MKTYHIITIGCQMNYADSERLASRLEQNGYKKTDDKYGANLVIVNTCGVRQSAENRIYGLIPKIKKESASRRIKVKIILTGCLAERKDVQRRLREYVDEWLPISAMSNGKFPMASQCQMTNVKYQNNYLEIKPKYESKFSAFVPIGNGCDNFCSYCVVPYARGREVYRPAREIIDEVKNLVKKGYKEIILIAQNVNSYKSGENDFSYLLKAVDGIKGDFWIRFLTSHPKNMSQKLIKTMAVSGKVCLQVYLPVQAGDDEVLKKMNRKYTRADYIKLVEKIRKVLNSPRLASRAKQANPRSAEFTTKPLLRGAIWQPPVAITTDLIVGFPGETKKQFNNSVKLFKKIKFDMAYISAYSARPGTAAFKLTDNVSREEKMNRKNQLDRILRLTALANNKKYIGKTVRVLVENKTKAGEWFGKTAAGKDIRFSSELASFQIGDFVKVKVTGAKEFCLAGRIV